jgi:hypothetical protein
MSILPRRKGTISPGSCSLMFVALCCVCTSSLLQDPMPVAWGAGTGMDIFDYCAWYMERHVLRALGAQAEQGKGERATAILSVWGVLQMFADDCIVVLSSLA